VVPQLVSRSEEWQDELTRELSDKMSKLLEHYKPDFDALIKNEKNQLPLFLDLLKSTKLNSCLELSVGGKLCIFVNYHHDDPTQIDVVRLKDFINKLNKKKLIYRWDQRGAIVILRNNEVTRCDYNASEGSRIYYSMCLLCSPIKGVGYHVLLQITPTLCQNPRPDYIVYCVESGNVAHWKDSTTLQENKFYCDPNF
jgi:hypothetical protein